MHGRDFWLLKWFYSAILLFLCFWEWRVRWSLYVRSFTNTLFSVQWPWRVTPHCCWLSRVWIVQDVGRNKKGGGDFYLPFSSRPSTALWLGLITLSTWVWARFPAAVPDLIFHVGAAPLQANSPSSRAHWLTGSIFLLAGPLTNICFESLFYLINHIHLSSYLYHYSWLILKHQDCFIS